MTANLVLTFAFNKKGHESEYWITGGKVGMGGGGSWREQESGYANILR